MIFDEMNAKKNWSATNRNRRPNLGISKAPLKIQAHQSTSYGSVGEHKMRGDRGSRKGDTGEWSGRAGWLDGEELTKVRGLGGLEGVVGYGQDLEVDALWDF